MGKRKMSGIMATCATAIIIFDTKTVISGAQEGIQLCLQTIIPALFPFIILSGIINSALLGQPVKLLRPLGKLCKIPNGAESLLLLGFLGGYPVGAQTITQAYKDGSLLPNTAKRLLGFCNNAGPAFLFGIFSVIFSRKMILWALWIIHILSALAVGLLLPGESESICKIRKQQPTTIPKAVQNAIKTTAYICGWVVIFRIILCLCNKWILWRLAPNIQVLLSGILELSNGCVLLQKISSENIRFLYASGILAFGGLCVMMQTNSVTQDLGFGYYFPGKILQTLIALLLSLIIQPFLFRNINFILYLPVILVLLLLIGMTICLLYRKKLWHLQEKCCIIPVKSGRREQLYAVSKKDYPIM